MEASNPKAGEWPMANRKSIPQHGKKPNQKLKAYLVYEYLQRNTDDENFASATAIISYLQERGIEAERRSIYRDIKDINKLFYLLENEEADMAEAEEEIDADEDDELKTIVYDRAKQGFYVKRRLNFENDVRLLAECVYATKFVDAGTAALLVDTVCRLVSDFQAEKIRHDVYLADRVKTDNSGVYHSVDVINEAMNHRENGVRKPQKISFRYQTYNISDLKKKAYRRGGALYIVSPFQLIINDGNYYLLGYDDKFKKMLTYRIDRMERVQIVSEPREGAKEYEEVNLTAVFNMFKGEKRSVRLKCINSLLDTMIERFGTKNASYSKADDEHFIVSAEVEVSDQFFGWILGFGRKVVLINPSPVVQQFTEYLDRVREMYENNSGRHD